MKKLTFTITLKGRFGTLPTLRKNEDRKISEYLKKPIPTGISLINFKS